eukprot:1976504-Rhodomonas_salina.3
MSVPDIAQHSHRPADLGEDLVQTPHDGEALRGLLPCPCQMSQDRTAHSKRAARCEAGHLALHAIMLAMMPLRA